MSEEESDWISGLPELEGLFADHVTAAALIRPFSLLSLPFFRRKHSLPSDNALATLRSASAFVNSSESIDFDTAVKALIALRTYIIRYKFDAGKATESATQSEHLLEAYLRGFYVAARAASLGPWNSEMAEASKDCMMGYLEINRQMTEETKEGWRPHVLGAIFPASSDDSHLLTPFFDRPRQLTDEILHHHIQRSSGKKALRDSAGESCPTDPIKEHTSEAEYLLKGLSLFSRHIASIDSLPLVNQPNVSLKTSKAKLKAIDDESRRRPLRIALEARIIQCELASALASIDVVNIKVRARGKSRSPTPELQSDDGSSVTSDEVDVKPDVRSRATKSPAASPKLVDPPDALKEVDTVAVWDEKAEDILFDLLEYARQLLEDRNSSVLIDTPQRSDWLGTFPATDPPKSPGTKSTGSECEDNSEHELESDSSSDLDPSSSPAGATPLRAIFRLQDRYEELRLAVWLSLPPDSRGKMSAYMRGAPTPTQMLRIKGPNMGAEKFKEMMNGRIGEAWDRFGMAMLKKFDSRELQRHGLDPEKLDKWEELVSIKSIKRAKKGRKTV